MKQLLNFDTIYADQKFNSNPCNCVFKLNNSITNVSKISLKSFEFPISFYNVRNGINTFSINILTDNGLAIIPSYVNYEMTPKNYTKIADLLTDMNTMTASIHIVFSVNSVNKIVATCSDVNVIFSFNRTTFTYYVLGIDENILSEPTVTGTRIYNLNCDNYLNMSISNIPTKSNPNVNSFNSNFKILCNAVYPMILYNQENSGFTQTIELHENNNFILNKFEIKIYDRFNLLITNLDFSFTLEIESN
jgi:hypothetical protein